MQADAEGPSLIRNTVHFFVAHGRCLYSMGKENIFLCLDAFTAPNTANHAVPQPITCINAIETSTVIVVVGTWVQNIDNIDNVPYGVVKKTRPGGDQGGRGCFDGMG